MMRFSAIKFIITALAVSSLFISYDSVAKQKIILSQIQIIARPYTATVSCGKTMLTEKNC